MNARQKAKRYKRKYKELLNHFIEYKAIPDKIDTLSFEHYYSRKFPMGENALHAKEIVVSDIAHVLARHVIDNFDKYVDYRIWFNPYVEKYHITAKVDICRKEK